MSSTVDQIRQILTAEFNPIDLHIEDESYKHAGHAGVKGTTAGHFIVHITASNFTGQSRINCHRMINLSLKELFKTKIHALCIHAKEP